MKLKHPDIYLIMTSLSHIFARWQKHFSKQVSLESQQIWCTNLQREIFFPLSHRHSFVSKVSCHTEQAASPCLKGFHPHSISRSERRDVLGMFSPF